MVQPKIYVDNILVNWGDKLFYPAYRSPGQHRTPRAPVLSGNRIQHARGQIVRTIKRTPEVMVKISSRGGSGKGMAAICNHLDYITRNGKLEMEDPDGHKITSKQELEAFKKEWDTTAVGKIPEKNNRREAFNIIFSMPSGTPAHDVKNATREFLKEEFEGRDYVFVLHEDTGKPHVHVCIKAAPTKKGQKRLNPRKADLQRWREGFAEHLRDHGIAANATPRQTRAITTPSVGQHLYHQAKERDYAIRPCADRGAIEWKKQSCQKQHQAWFAMASALTQSEERSDRQMGRDIANFWQEASIQPTRNIEEKTQNGRTTESGKVSRKVALYQYSFAKDRGEAPAKGHSHLRVLSSRGVVQHSGSTQMLLRTDAHGLLGRKGTADPRVRW